MFILVNISLNAQSLKLFVPDELCMSTQPTISTTVQYNVTLLLGDCIHMYGTNPGENAVEMGLGLTDMTQGLKATIIATARLNSITSDSSGTQQFNFGNNCGEDDADDANVIIHYSGLQASEEQMVEGTTSFRLPVSSENILVVTGNNTPLNPDSSEDFIQVNASRTNTATVSINTNEKQGQVYIAIIKAEGYPFPIALLNPKSTDNLSFTVDQNVYVVPMIKPKFVRVGTESSVIFEVGDPRKNGKAEVEEL
jgi:hypothetical protein